MKNWSTLEVNDLDILTDAEIRDVVAWLSTKHEPLSQREADILSDGETIIQNEEVDVRDYWNDVASDAEVDADTLASAGWGTDEDYGDYGGDRY